MIKGGVKAKEKPGAEGEEGAERQRQVAAVSDTLRPSRTVRYVYLGGPAPHTHTHAQPKSTQVTHQKEAAFRSEITLECHPRSYLTFLIWGVPIALY
jgi:hypothetical protein